MTSQKVSLPYHDMTYPQLTSVGAFYMVGDIESARAKGEKILADLEKN